MDVTEPEINRALAKGVNAVNAKRIARNKVDETGRRMRGAVPDTLTEELARQLTPGLRTAVSKKLIELATTGSNVVTLNAIKEILDRLEGRTRQASGSETTDDTLLIQIFKNVYKEDERLTQPEAEWHVLPPLVEPE